MTTVQLRLYDVAIGGSRTMSVPALLVPDALPQLTPSLTHLPRQRNAPESPREERIVYLDAVRRKHRGRPIQVSDSTAVQVDYAHVVSKKRPALVERFTITIWHAPAGIRMEDVLAAAEQRSHAVPGCSVTHQQAILLFPIKRAVQEDLLAGRKVARQTGRARSKQRSVADAHGPAPRSRPRKSRRRFVPHWVIIPSAVPADLSDEPNARWWCSPRKTRRAILRREGHLNV